MHLVMIGGSDAGISAALRARELDPGAEVSVVVADADALVTRGLSVIQMEQLPEVLPTVDPALGRLVHGQLARRGVEVLTGTTVRQITRAPLASLDGCGWWPPRRTARRWRAWQTWCWSSASAQKPISPGQPGRGAMPRWPRHSRHAS